MMKWLLHFTLQKRDAIVKAVKSRSRRKTHKYGIEIPRDIKHAYKLDRQNGNTFWSDAIAKEMHNAGIAFEIMEDDQPLPVGF
jgi:hypothetical protein